jgi:DNA repair protein RadC
MELREIAIEDRPRERAVRSGVGVLGDRELLAALLGSGNQRAGALELASRLLARHGIRWLASATVAQLMREPGIGLAQATRIAAAFELSRRSQRAPRGQLLDTSDAIAAAIAPVIEHEREEVLHLIVLDAKLGFVRTVEVARGGAAGLGFQPRDVLGPALREGAVRIAIAHNHPSGDPRPSPEDRSSTITLALAGALIGIELVDHIIIGRDDWVSLRREGVIDGKRRRRPRRAKR